MFRRHTIAMMATSMLAFAALGQEPLPELTPPSDPPKPFRVTVIWDNDGTVIKPNHNTDRHYTNGFQFVLGYHPQWADEIAVNWFDLKPMANDERTVAGGIVLGQNIYTPDFIGNPAARNPLDRQYAAWLYLGAYWQHEADDHLDHFQLDIGIVGEASAGRAVQDAVHEFFEEDKPLGWENQLGDEIGFNLSLNRLWRHDLLAQPDEPANIQLIPQAGITLGTQNRHVTLGAMLRAGQNLPADYGPARIELPASAITLQPEGSGWYVFARVGGKWVLHNRLLSGTDPESLMGEAQFGIAIHFKSVTITYSQTFMTQEFETQDGKDDFGSLVVSFAHHF